MILVVLGSSCQTVSPEPHAGDLAPFLLDRAADYGGRIQNRQNLPPVQAEWSCEYDRSRVQIVVRGNRLTEIAAVLRQAFGEPRSPIQRLESGGFGGGYWIGDIGVAIRIFGDDCHTVITCIHPQFH